MKRKLLYGITLGLPMTLYLIFAMALNGVKVDYHIRYKDKTYQEYTLDNGNIFIRDSFGNIEYVEGKITYNAYFDDYGIEIKNNEIIRINKDYYVIKLDEKTNLNKLALMEKEDKAIKESGGWGLVVIVSLMTLGIIGLVISGKMKWKDKEPMLAVLLALVVGTIVLGFINLIVNSMFTTFLIATGSWGLFTAEYYYNKNKDKAFKNEIKGLNDLVRLEQELEDLKRLAGKL